MRKQALSEINRLIDNHCKQCPVFEHKMSNSHPCKTNCDIGSSLIKLGKDLRSTSVKRTEEVLNKGKDMTTKEIKYLVEKGVTKKEIVKSWRVNHNQGMKMINEILSVLESVG